MGICCRLFRYNGQKFSKEYFNCSIYSKYAWFLKVGWHQHAPRALSPYALSVCVLVWWVFRTSLYFVYFGCFLLFWLTFSIDIVFTVVIACGTRYGRLYLPFVSIHIKCIVCGFIPINTFTWNAENFNKIHFEICDPSVNAICSNLQLSLLMVMPQMPQIPLHSFVLGTLVTPSIFYPSNLSRCPCHHHICYSRS